MLAGGESRRFGGDKAAASIGGVSLLERAAGTLARVFRDVVIVSAIERPTTAWPRVPDLRAGCGPLGGIEAALVHANEPPRPSRLQPGLDDCLDDALLEAVAADPADRAFSTRALSAAIDTYAERMGFELDGGRLADLVTSRARARAA